MRRFAAALLALILIPAGVTAHHVEEPGAYLDEYRAQRGAIIESLRLFQSAASPTEARDVLLAVEGVIATTLEHMASLDVPRSCLATAQVINIEFDAVADAVTALRSGDTVMAGEAWARADAASDLLGNAIFVELHPCTED